MWVDVDLYQICLFMHACTQYATETQEFGDGSGRQGVRLTLLNPQLQDSGHYVCTAENQFERATETVQLSVWLPGVHNIVNINVRTAELGTCHGSRGIHRC